jgi:putative nucleotidyltransferase with HDIG domain
MGTVNIVDLKSGMVLAKNILDRDCCLLLGQGTVLSEKHLQIIRKRGITEVEVEGISKEEIKEEKKEGIPQDIQEKAEELTRQRFVHVNTGTEAGRELFDLCCARKARQLMRPGSGDQTSAQEKAEEPPAAPAQLTAGEILSAEDLKLPSLPIIFKKIRKVLNDPNSSAQQISSVISNDTNLSAKLLRIVNSAFYSRMSKVDTLSRAVTILGTRQLSELALGVSILSVFKNIPGSMINMKSFWAHSTAVAIVARTLGEQKQSENSERSFVAGLLHDIGRLVLYQWAPDHCRTAMALALKEKCLLFEAEQRIIGFDHAYIGGQALRKWEFPAALTTAARRHHEPRKAEDAELAAIVHVSDTIVNAMGIGSSGETLVPPFNPGIWSLLELPVSLIPKTMIEVDRQLSKVVQMLYED